MISYPYNYLFSSQKVLDKSIKWYIHVVYNDPQLTLAYVSAKTDMLAFVPGTNQYWALNVKILCLKD